MDMEYVEVKDDEIDEFVEAKDHAQGDGCGGGWRSNQRMMEEEGLSDLRKSSANSGSTPPARLERRNLLYRNYKDHQDVQVSQRCMTEEGLNQSAQ